MRAVVLAGGFGGARLSSGLRDHLSDPDDEVSIIVNTADDVRLHGLHISPDLDTVMYTLGGGLDRERGWGRQDEEFRANEELKAYNAPAAWFGLGDRDLATHLIRTQMREAGYSLTEVTDALCKRWEPGARILPMTDDRVETHAVVQLEGKSAALHFQEWWIRYRAELPTARFLQVGIESAKPTQAVYSAIDSADVIVVAPSNPVVSIDPILGLPGMLAALQESTAPIVGISPIIGGQPLRGMADKCLDVIGVETTALGVGAHYGSRLEGGLLDVWLIDKQDQMLAPAVEALGIRCFATDTVMADPNRAAGLSEQAITLAARSAGA